MRWTIFACAVLLAAPVQAEPDHEAIVEAAVVQHIIPAYERFAATADALPDAAQDCDAAALRGAYHQAFDAWMGAQHIAFGPVETEQLRFAIAFWPDTKGFARKALERLIKAEDPVVDDPEGFAKISVAARGLLALERLLYNNDGETGFSGDNGSYKCRIAQAIAQDLAASGAKVLAGWRDEQGVAQFLTTAGDVSNALYPQAPDATRDLFTSLDGGLQALVDLRLGRPLGSFAKPRPRRAEAWRSGRSLRNIQVSLDALRRYYNVAFLGAVPTAQRDTIKSAFDKAVSLAQEAPSPLHEAVSSPGTRIAVEALQTQIRAVHGLLRQHLAPEIGSTLTFNALDGD